MTLPSLSDPMQPWNHVDMLVEALPWLHELALEHAKSDAEKLMAARLPTLLSDRKLHAEAHVSKCEAMDQIRTRFIQDQRAEIAHKEALRKASVLKAAERVSR